MQINARQQQNLGVRTADVARRTLVQKLSAFGTVAIDERSVETVPALASGLIVKLYVNASQQFVKRTRRWPSCGSCSGRRRSRSIWR